MGGGTGCTEENKKGHLRFINNIMNPGAEGGQEDKVREAIELKSTVIPVVSLLVKDHKPCGEDGTPKSKSKPVCGASSSLNGELSEWVALNLDSVNASLPTNEVISYKELLAHVDDFVD